MKTILIHGLGQTAGAWNKTAELLPQEDALCPELSAFIGGGSYGELYYGFSRCSCAGCRWARFWR